ncbi:MAG: penicillin-binding protein 2 [Bacteroidales bacterium]|nr:penicillin-binding protein 2 [Bacteroidales bacterium]MCF8333505.1 penicillin-binding protein 2 [Bacteroidales bacterium]
MRSNYQGRKYIILGIIIVVALIYIGRLFYLQVASDKYAVYAESNVLRKITKYPSRGLIYDRDSNIMVYNETAYDVMVVPRRVQAFDTTEMAKLLKIPEKSVEKRIQKAKSYSYLKPSVFLQQISKKTYAYFEEQLYKYPGFYVQKRSLREYPNKAAAHILGYVGEVSNQHLREDDYYDQGDYIGISGLEKTYEKQLRGKKGLELVMVDVHNREKGSYKNGKYDTAAVKGKDIFSTIDFELQSYGEKLMEKKKGSIVAIEPATGEILALVSSPTYDPNLLVGRVRGENYMKLKKDTLRPLFNRALMAQYSPGSTFKLMNGLIALDEDVIRPSTRFECNGVNSWPIKCSHNHKSPLNLIEAIEYSCNPYFWKTFRSSIRNPEFKTVAESFSKWRDYVISMGFNQRFDSDVTNEKKGFIPKKSYYDRYYSAGHWNAMTIRSLAIGQGEILVTPLQLANFSAALANRGYYYPPHLVRKIGESNTHYNKPENKKKTKINDENFEPVIEGMHQVFEGDHGTARWYDIDSIPMGGKTGTVQNPHGKDHSIFIAFAPQEKPNIALSVIVENSGYGSKWAVPIATLMIEKYLKGEISRKWVEDRMLEGNLIAPEQKEDDNSQ